jgi:hypothetical protein
MMGRLGRARASPRSLACQHQAVQYDRSKKLSGVAPMISKRRLLQYAAAIPLLGPGTAARALTGSNLIVHENRLFLDVVVNGHPVRALLDSAAESSFMDLAFARQIGVAGGTTVEARGSGGDTTASLAKGVVIEALGLRLGPLTVALLDLSDIGRRLLRGPLPFVLGRELFDAARLSIDIAHGRIATRSRPVEPQGVRLGLSDERGLETFPASVEGHAAVGTAFDLGNGGEVLIGADYAKQIGALSDGRPIVEKRGGGIGEERLRQTFMLRSLDIAGRRFSNVPAAVDANGSATKLNVGVDILRNFDIVTDFSAHCLWLRAL